MNFDDQDETILDMAVERGMTREDAEHEYNAYRAGNHGEYTRRIQAVIDQYLALLEESRNRWYENE